jgi:hypothetical protein
MQRLAQLVEYLRDRTSSAAGGGVMMMVVTLRLRRLILERLLNLREVLLRSRNISGFRSWTNWLKA